MIKVNYYFLYVLSTLMLLLIVACKNDGNTSNADTGTIVFDSIVVDTTAVLDATHPDMKATVHLSIKYAKGNDAINKSIMASGIFYPEDVVVPGKDIKEVMTNYMRQYVSDYKEDYNSIYRFEPQGAKPLTAEHRVSTDIVGASRTTFAYQATVYQYAGGEDGTTSRVIMNFDKQTGKRINLNDVLVPGADQVLMDAVIEQLCKKLEVKDLAGLREKMYFVGVTPYLSDDFILSDDEVTFVYAQDEIAPHDQGEIKLTVSIDQLTVNN